MTMTMHWSIQLTCVLSFLSPIICGSSFLSLILGGRSTNQENEEIASRIRIRIYEGSSIGTATTTDFPVREDELIYYSIDHTKPLVLYIHGFREHPSNKSIQTVVGAHLERGSDNIILLDWSDLAFQNYITVIAAVRDIARTLTRTFDRLVRLGLNLETFHCVGHSLGAQICGFLGKYSSNSIPRITGLDPANPGFYHPGAEHIDAKSARFVDIIHTDGGIYGALVSTGTVDFFANGGTRPQPGCTVVGIPLTPSDLCNHWRSWRYYAESVLNEFAFPAVECPSYSDFLANKCTWNQHIYAGYATPTNARGTYYFTTNSRSPFSKSASTFGSNPLET